MGVRPSPGRMDHVTVRLTLICHAETTALRHAVFASQESLTERGVRQAGQAAQGASGAVAWSSPAQACVQTAEALGVRARIEPALRDCDFGTWTGRPLAEIEDTEGDALRAWLTDPAARPHGGESLLDVLERVTGWLARLEQQTGRVIAVTHPAVIRAAVVHTLTAPAAAFWRIDIPPLSQTHLTCHAGTWKLRASNAHSDR